MKKVILSTSLIALCFAAKAQPYAPGFHKSESIPEKPSAAMQLKASEKLPEYPGGEEAMMAFLSNNIRYPKEAKEQNIQGRVVIKFTIDNDGTIKNAEVMRGIGGGCDEEALRVINAMPKWKPGYQDGKPIKVYYALPISFKF